MPIDAAWHVELAMIFTSSDDMSFELHVIGYEFPAEQIADYDSNWLNIRIDVRHPLGHWSRTHPALLTYEVQRLAEWFIALAAGDRAQTERSFVEPNLSFEVVGHDTEKLRISFRLEFSPPWTEHWRRGASVRRVSTGRNQS